MCIIKNNKVINTTLSINIYTISFYILRHKGGDILALEAIEAIKKSEANAKQLINDANNEAREIISKAKEDAQKQYEDVLAKAKEKTNKLINDAVNIGNKEAEPILAKGKKDAEDILNISDDKKNNAVKLVVERIVKIHGNS